MYLSSPLPHTCCTPLSHSSPFDHPSTSAVHIIKLVTMQSNAPPVISSLIFSNILSTLCLHSSLSGRDQVSHPYKTTGKIIFLYVLIYVFLDRKTKDFAPNDGVSLFFTNAILILGGFPPNIWTVHTFRGVLTVFILRFAVLVHDTRTRTQLSLHALLDQFP